MDLEAYNKTMLLLVQNNILTQNRAKTYLTAAVAAAGTTLTVKAVDTNAWADNDWVIVGEIGSPTAEVLQINGAVSDGTSITVDNAGSGGARFAHAVNEPIYRVDYNKIRWSWSSTESGSKTVLTTTEIQPDSFETRYEDSANTTGYGFAQFNNSATNAYSPYSDAIPYAGQSLKSLQKMIAKVRTLIDEKDDSFVSDDEITDAINDKQRDIIDERLWTFNEDSYSAATVQYQFEYDMPSLLKTLHTVRQRTWPLASVSQARFELLNWNTQTQSSNPTMVSVWNRKVRLWPRPNTAARTTQLNGGITSSDTSITVDDGSSFLVGDYYRFIIDSEVIYATNYNSTTDIFSGCLRGQEGTTAASHLDNATVTERDIVFTGQKMAVDLSGLNDETVVPEPIVICYGVSADLCHGKLNKSTLGDRYDIKYTKGIEGLRNKYTLKITSQFGRVRKANEVIRDDSPLINPNNFPQDVSAT